MKNVYLKAFHANFPINHDPSCDYASIGRAQEVSTAEKHMNNDPVVQAKK